MLVNRNKSWFWLILKFRSPSGHITFDPPHWKVIFKSVHHPSLWGVYPEVLMALAQNCWENSISLYRLGEKSQKHIFRQEETFSFGHNLNLCLYLYCAYLYYLYFCLPEPHQSITRRKCILRMSSVSFIVIFGALALAGGKSQLISISIYKAWLVLHASQCWHNNLWIWYD